MFNSNEISTIQCCLSNYIESAKAQLDCLTIGVKGCNDLAEIYQAKINECYELQKKLEFSAFSEITIPVKQTGFTHEDLKKVESVIDLIFTKLKN